MSLSKTILAPLLCANILLITGCGTEIAPIMDLPNTSQTANQLEDDTNFSNKLQNLIDTQYPQAKVKIMSDHFNVLVVGQIDNEQTQAQIINLIKTQAITKQVWDYATIQPKPKLNINSKITTKAQDRVDTEYNITQDHVQVITVDNVVYIMGDVNVAHTSNLNDAMPGVYAIEGVIKVVSLVQFHE